MKLLFLDFDGVLNTPFSKRDDVLYYTKDVQVTKSSIDCLLQILKNDVKIVWHASWVYQDGFKDTVDKIGLSDYTIDYLRTDFSELNTDGKYNSALDRIERIKLGLRKYNPINYCILDDFNLEEHFGSNFYMTKDYLKSSDVDNILSILHEEPQSVS